MSEEYRKILGPSLFSRKYIHAGKDHLLIISGIYSERYRRIRYADIQTLVMRETERVVVTAICLLILCFIGLLLLLTGIYEPATGPIVWGIILLTIFLPLAIYDIARGKTCKAALVTAVQQVSLGNVSRVRRFRKLHRFLQEKIYEELGERAPTDEEVRAAAKSVRSPTLPPPLPREAPEPPPLPRMSSTIESD